MALPANRDILVQYYTPWLVRSLLMLDYVVCVVFECSEDRSANVEWFYRVNGSDLLWYLV